MWIRCAISIAIFDDVDDVQCTPCTHLQRSLQRIHWFNQAIHTRWILVLCGNVFVFFFFLSSCSKRFVCGSVFFYDGWYRMQLVFLILFVVFDFRRNFLCIDEYVYFIYIYSQFLGFYFLFTGFHNNNNNSYNYIFNGTCVCLYIFVQNNNKTNVSFARSFVRYL